MDVEMSHFDL